jgi:D-serine dehydratase
MFIIPEREVPCFLGWVCGVGGGGGGVAQRKYETQDFCAEVKWPVDHQ